jgi:hypothetical protein
VTQDARESVTAIVSVSLFFGASYFALQILEMVDIPRWVPAVGLVLNLATFAWLLIRRRIGSDAK